MKTTFSSDSTRVRARSPWLWPILISVMAVAVMLVTFGNVAAPIRPLIGFLFLLTCPGMAVVGLLRMRDGVAEWTLTLAASLAIDALVAGSMAYARAWSPE